MVGAAGFSAAGAGTTVAGVGAALVAGAAACVGGAGFASSVSVCLRSAFHFDFSPASAQPPLPTWRLAAR